MVLVVDLTDHHEALLLGGGAFDVIGLPTSAERLTSRIIAIHRNVESNERRSRARPAPRIVIRGSLAISPELREARVGANTLALTKPEFELLLALARQPIEC